jgi:hypothetical protein
MAPTTAQAQLWRLSVSDTALNSIAYRESNARLPVIRAGFMRFTQWIANEKRRAVARQVAAAVMELQHPGVIDDLKRASVTADRASNNS